LLHIVTEDTLPWKHNTFTERLGSSLSNLPTTNL
jgi:hypothetical protein